jgi:methionyl aminopeptidase
MIILKSQREIELMREAGRIVSDLLKRLERLIVPGITTLELDRFAEKFILSQKGKPAFKGYIPHFKKYYPATLCTSVNESIVHEIPSNRVLKKGDIVSIDVGVLFEGYYGDGAWTFPVGEIDPIKKDLLRTTKEALYEGIKKAVVGNHLFDISSTIQEYITKRGFSVAHEFTGHGIGSRLHEEPVVPNLGSPGRGPKLLAGMTLAIEPMVNVGTGSSKILQDGWCAVTMDNKPSAHFEHTIAITDSGPQILTLRC